MASKDKPPKPYPDFPLYAHGSGHWAKKIRGKTRYFGRWEDGWQEALKRFNDEKDAWYAGRTPDRYDDEDLLVGRAADLFMSSKLRLLRSSELRQRTFDDYEVTCDLVVETFGKTRPVTSLTAADFEYLREVLAQRFGPARMSREIGQIRMIFRYCYRSGHLDKPLRHAENFKPPKARDLRLSRQRHGPKLFEPEEIRSLADKAGAPMKAMILLGINCAFGNHDCGLLKFSDLDLHAGWHDMARSKTGIERRAKLWPDTIEAIEAVMEKRTEPKSDEHDELVFITKRGGSWFKDSRDNPVSQEFRKVLNECELYRKGRTFYALRHTFRTIAAGTRDREAVDFIMGHADPSMAARYTEHFEDSRLAAVSEYVRGWFNTGIDAKTA